MQNSVEKQLQDIMLPLPQNGEFMNGTGCTLLFLNEYGLVVRFEYKSSFKEKRPDLKSDAILQPLLTIETEDWDMEVCPGLPILSYDVCKTYLKAIPLGSLQDEFNQRLKKDRLFLWDMQYENCGYMPDVSNPEKIIPIVIDRNAVREELATAVSLVNKILPWKNKHVDFPKKAQAVFDPLKEAFTRAAVEKGEERAGAFKKAYNLCREFREEGKLVCGWQEPDVCKNKTEKANEAASNYHQRLKDHHQKLFR